MAQGLERGGTNRATKLATAIRPQYDWDAGHAKDAITNHGRKKNLSVKGDGTTGGPSGKKR